MINNNVSITQESEPVAKADSTNPKLTDWRLRACHTVKEASEIVSTPPSQIRKLCREGKINPITGFGRKWRIATEDIERLLGQRLRHEVTH
jgi:excisionase family DNA binding protein